MISMCCPSSWDLLIDPMSSSHRHHGVPEDIVLLLDGSDGRTSRALQEQLPEVHCLAPNVAPETQQKLEKLPKCTSWCGRIEDIGLH